MIIILIIIHIVIMITIMIITAPALAARRHSKAPGANTQLIIYLFMLYTYHNIIRIYVV